MVGELHLLFLSDVISVVFSAYSMSHPEKNGFEAFLTLSHPLLDELKKCGCSDKVNLYHRG
jgi:hypothetical protein